MGLNTRFEKAVVQTVVDPAAMTVDAVAVTFTTNAPTPSATQTIADGTVPTVAELGQWVANQEVVLEAVEVDLDVLRAQLVAAIADIASIYATLNSGE